MCDKNLHIQLRTRGDQNHLSVSAKTELMLDYFHRNRNENIKGLGFSYNRWKVRHN